ncbi:hypothetical protein IHE44_0002779 [Lamprotornis superbus]|uniref:Homer protein homolog 2 n=1 Tax=Lamprotornis superbus TaxID=245042 RepID=A0A835P3K5_9PASS|nr:hypothetical protein IHE44_0002779 [Lamprotornis superbus]
MPELKLFKQIQDVIKCLKLFKHIPSVPEPGRGHDVGAAAAAWGDSLARAQGASSSRPGLLECSELRLWLPQCSGSSLGGSMSQHRAQLCPARAGGAGHQDQQSPLRIKNSKTWVQLSLASPAHHSTPVLPSPFTTDSRGVGRFSKLEMCIYTQTHASVSAVPPYCREQPIFTTRAHVFQIDPSTKKNWVPASKQAVTVSYFYDSTRNSYRIISVDGAKVIINSTITPNMTFTKTSQKFGQWADSRANTVFGLGFPSEQQLTKFAEKFQEVKEAAKLARDRSQEKIETSSNHSQTSFAAKMKREMQETPSVRLCVVLQESGRETPSSTRASSVNGTDDEKASHGGPAEAHLKSENDKLKIALAQSSSNVKKWETELQSLRESNARLSTALQESAASIEHWKKQFSACKEENEQLRGKIEELEEQCNEINKEKERNAQLSRRLQELETELQDKELELEELRKQGEIIPELMSECESVSEQLQAAEKKNKDLEEKVRTLRTEVEENKHRQTNLKTELKNFLDVLDGKIDELHDFRQGLSKLGVDN